MEPIQGKPQAQLADIGLTAPSQLTKGDNKTTEFLELFVAQLKNQDPLKPQEGADFLAQLAQFSTVEGIKNMESSFQKLSDSLQSTAALQASSLVGRNVEVNSNLAAYQEGTPVTGSIELPRTVPNLALEIHNEYGEVVKRYEMGVQERGTIPFKWDGFDDNGNAQSSGVYKIVATGTVENNNEQFETFVAANVDSVTLKKGEQGLILNVSGYGSVAMSDVRTIS